MNYQELKANRKKFLDMTSLEVEEFNNLLISFEKAWHEYQEEKEKNRKTPRKRKKGGGRKGKIKNTEDKLLFILVYHKTYRG